MNYYLDAFKNYAKFDGRASRKAYWMFYLINFIVSFVAGFADGFLGLGGETYGPIGGLYTLLVLIPAIAVGVRRLHDIDKSGWFLLIPIYNIVLLATKGSSEKNKYGEPVVTN